MEKLLTIVIVDRISWDGITRLLTKQGDAIGLR